MQESGGSPRETLWRARGPIGRRFALRGLKLLASRGPAAERGALLGPPWAFSRLALVSTEPRVSALSPGVCAVLLRNSNEAVFHREIRLARAWRLRLRAGRGSFCRFWMVSV